MDLNQALTIISGLFSFSTIIFVVYSLISNEIRKKLLFAKVSNLKRYNILVLFIPFLELILMIVIIYCEKFYFNKDEINAIVFFVLFLLFVISIIIQTFFILEPISKSDFFQEKLIDIDIDFIKIQIELFSLDKKEIVILRSIDYLLKMQLGQNKYNSNFWSLSEQNFRNYFKKLLVIDTSVKNRLSFINSTYSILLKYNNPFILKDFDIDRILILKVELDYINDDKAKFKNVLNNLSSILNIYKAEFNTNDLKVIIERIINILSVNNDFTDEMIEFSLSSMRSAIDAYLIFNINKAMKEIILNNEMDIKTTKEFKKYLSNFELNGNLFIKNPRFVKMVNDQEVKL